jgi:hypothetical protein
MKTLGSLLLGLGLTILFLSAAEAGGGKDKEVKLTGRITCCKCDFDSVKAADPDAKKPKVCVTVIIAKTKKGEAVFIFDKAGHKKYHGKICTDPMDGTVTGTVAKKDGKRIITVSDVEFKK